MCVQIRLYLIRFVVPYPLLFCSSDLKYSNLSTSPTPSFFECFYVLHIIQIPFKYNLKRYALTSVSISMSKIRTTHFTSFENLYQKKLLISNWKRQSTCKWPVSSISYMSVDKSQQSYTNIVGRGMRGVHIAVLCFLTKNNPLITSILLLEKSNILDRYLFFLLSHNKNCHATKYEKYYFVYFTVILYK